LPVFETSKRHYKFGCGLCVSYGRAFWEEESKKEMGYGNL